MIKHNTIANRKVKADSIEVWKANIIEKEHIKDLLDKIRAEILVLDDAEYDFEGYYKAVTDALRIIDKYKAESEEE